MKIIFLIILTYISQFQKVSSPNNQNELKSDVINSRVSKISFEYDIKFGTTDEIFVSGIQSFVVDSENRVFIADDDQKTIHAFSSNGEYLESIGRDGRGPGEFTFMERVVMGIHSNELYATDAIGFFPHRVNIFSLDDFSLLSSSKLIAENQNEFKQLKGYFPSSVTLIENDLLLVTYSKPISIFDKSNNFIYFVIQDRSGNIVKKTELKQAGVHYLNLTIPKPFPVTIRHDFPFYKKPISVVSSEGLIYSIDSDQFKIDVYDLYGDDLFSINHSFTNLNFDKDEVIADYEESGYMSQLDHDEGVNNVIRLIEEADSLPTIWPAIDNMLLSDDDKIWVSTITNEKDKNEWWILDKTGSIITKFKWDKLKPISLINNGFVYTKEYDQEEGFNYVVRYKIRSRQVKGIISD